MKGGDLGVSRGGNYGEGCRREDLWVAGEGFMGFRREFMGCSLRREFMGCRRGINGLQEGGLSVS